MNMIQHVTTALPVNKDAIRPGVDRQRRRSIIREFALNTSTHGLPGIARSQSMHNRVFWSVSTLVFTGIMLYFVTESIINYFEYPKQTSIDVNVIWPIAYPAVTFCNYCPYRLDRFIVAFVQFLRTQNETITTNDTLTILRNYQDYFHTFFQLSITQHGSIHQLFFSLSSMLISCQFNGVSCTEKDFIAFESPSYGRCYTFNAKMKGVPNGAVRDSNQDGGNGVLQLRLYVHSHQYVPVETDAIGIMLMVHDNTELPLIDVAGTALEPGHKHRITFATKKRYFLPSPYTQCTERIPLAMSTMFNLYDNADYAYSQLLCYINCIQSYSYQECGCVSPYQWWSRFVVLFGTETIVEAPLCNFTDPCYVQAADHLMKDNSIWSVLCVDCQQECNTTNFDISSSFIRAPPEWMLESIRSFVENSSIPLPTDWSTAWRSYIESSYVAVDIVRQSLQIETWTQNPAFSGVDLLSNVGGLSGLWIGISFLSLMELAEMLYRLIRSNIHLIWIRNRNLQN